MLSDGPTRFRALFQASISCPRLARWRRFLGLASVSSTAAETPFWFGFALLYTSGCVALALHQAFATKYVLADDVRQHVFWMFRFVDPRLFPNDPIADYFQSIAPPGFTALYRGFAALGVDPLLASKLIPAVLGLSAAGYLFGVALSVLRSPATAALATILFCQGLWLSSDLCSATPRAFFYPLFAAFLYYHVKGRRVPVLATILLQGLFFPPAALISLGVIFLSFGRCERAWSSLVKQYRAYLFCAAALGITLLTLLPYWHATEKFGPLVTYAAARHMPEFGPAGRIPFFYSGFWNYWLYGTAGLHIQSRPFWLFAAFLWPILRCFPRYFPFLNRTPAGARLLLQIAGSALLLFIVSHALLFRLYLPSRYTEHTARVLFALAAAGAIMAIVDSLLRWSEQRAQRSRCGTAFGALAFAMVLPLSVICFPLFLSKFPNAGYITGTEPDLYRFFASQPPTIHIASLADEADKLPVFSRRSIVIAVETAIPLHLGYYMPLRQRGLEFARAQYSSDLNVIQQCLRHEHIDFCLLDQGAFTPDYVHNNRLLRQLGEIVPTSPAGAKPLMQHPPPQCIVFANAHFMVLDARALLALKSSAAAAMASQNSGLSQ